MKGNRLGDSGGSTLPAPPTEHRKDISAIDINNLTFNY